MLGLNKISKCNARYGNDLGTANTLVVVKGKVLF